MVRRIRRWWRRATASTLLLVLLVPLVLVGLGYGAYRLATGATAATSPGDTPTKPPPGGDSSWWPSWADVTGIYEDVTTSEQRNALAAGFLGLFGGK